MSARIFLTVIFLAATLGPAVGQQSAGVTVIVNGNTMTFDQPPEIETGRVFVPLRGIFEQLGASVVYQNGTINATSHGRTVSLQIGSTSATVDGQTQTLDAPAFITGSRTLVPLRFVAQALGASVDWNNNTSTVTINGGYGHPGYNGAPPPPQQRPVMPREIVVDQRPLGQAQPRSTISASFAGPVRQASLRVTLDGNDITSALYFNRDGGFQYTPRRPLYPGEHTVRVSGIMMNGRTFNQGWDFRV